jgi:hypothetical protein
MGKYIGEDGRQEKETGKDRGGKRGEKEGDGEE